MGGLSTFFLSLLGMGKEDADESKTGTLVLRKDFARIVIETGEDKGKECQLEKSSVTIGRHIKNDICMPHSRTVSRFHGRIYFDRAEGYYFFEDLNSTNGTTIGNRLIRNEKVRIRHGDRIILGKQTSLIFFTKKLGIKDWILGY